MRGKNSVREETRECIVTALVRLTADKPLSAITVTELCRTAGVSPRAADDALQRAEAARSRHLEPHAHEEPARAGGRGAGSARPEGDSAPARGVLAHRTRRGAASRTQRALRLGRRADARDWGFSIELLFQSRLIDAARWNSPARGASGVSAGKRHYSPCGKPLLPIPSESGLQSTGTHPADAK